MKLKFQNEYDDRAIGDIVKNKAYTELKKIILDKFAEQGNFPVYVSREKVVEITKDIGGIGNVLHDFCKLQKISWHFHTTSTESTVEFRTIFQRE
jgi:hypothetical protein